jgi:hypothetical protein
MKCSPGQSPGLFLRPCFNALSSGGKPDSQFALALIEKRECPALVLSPQGPALAEHRSSQKHDGWRTMLMLEAWLTLRDIRLLVAVIVDAIAVVVLIIGAHALAATLFIVAALTLYSLLDWLTHHKQ